MRHIYPFAGAAIDGTFSVWAPFKNSVSLSILTPEPTTHEMKKDEQGYWKVNVPGVQAGTRYQYLLDDELLRPDPASRYQPEGVHGPSEVIDPGSFKWSDDDWKGLDLSSMIIYELHTGTFSPQRNFQGVISRLEYLRSLGVNAIEIMPIAQFPGNRNWGYDGVFPFAVHNTYGTVNGLKELVNAAHKRGIAVILDVVYNHLGPEGNYLGDFGPYFTDKYKTPWGKAINYDDAWCDAVRAYYIQNALMWLEEFHIDGLRMDAVHAIWDTGARHFTEELSELVDQLPGKKFLIAEIDYNSPRYITPREKGGYGMHGQWIDEFHHALHSVLTKEVNGYYADFGGLAPLAKSFRDSYVFTGEYSKVRNRNFGVAPSNNNYDQFVVFSQNHDQIGNRMMGDRRSTLVSFEALKLSAAVTLLSPHVPMLFMGEEYGETNPFQFFCSHSDEELIAAVRKGRKEEFASFAWEGEVPDPQSETTYNNSMLSWKTEGSILLEYYRYLIAFRKTRKAFANYSRNSVNVRMHGLMLVVERGNLLLLFNFGEQDASYQCKGNLEKKFDSAAAIWNGPGATAPDENTETGIISLPPLSAVVYEIL
jgi:maltooligosyltrehalose trehalohydrolase